MLDVTKTKVCGELKCSPPFSVSPSSVSLESLETIEGFVVLLIIIIIIIITIYICLFV
jgi:hypothetical protein